MLKRSYIAALFYSIRPTACFGVSLFAVAGLGRWDEVWVVLLIFFSSFIGAAGCFLINDIFDREKDLKNNKFRPIAIGEISVRTASIIAVFCCLIMLFSCFFLSMESVYIAVVLLFLFWLYPFVNRRFGLLANVWVSICSSIAFVYGASVYEFSPVVYLAIVFAFFVNIARETLLDALDQEGDKQVGKPSIPISFGEKGTKKVVALLFVLGSIALITYLVYFPTTWPWIVTILFLLWVPFFMKRETGFEKWAIFNVRTSHAYFLALIGFIFYQSYKPTIMPQTIDLEFALNKIEALQVQEDGFYPAGSFPSQRYWLARKGVDDNNVFITATVAYILRSVDTGSVNDRIGRIIDNATGTFEKYRNKYGEASYNYWLIHGDHFPNSLFLSRESLRIPDDYDVTALVQLARGAHPMDLPVREKMLKYAMRPERKVVDYFPSEHRFNKLYEVWYATKMPQQLDLVVMSNVLLFAFEKGFELQTPDLHTIEALKSSIDEAWYFKKASGFGYVPHYRQPAMRLYALTRMVAKDAAGKFDAQRATLIKHLYQALDQTDAEMERVLLATSLLRMGEQVSLDLSVQKIMKEVKSFETFAHNPGFEIHFPPALFWKWKSEAQSWAHIYELLSLRPTIHWK